MHQQFDQLIADGHLNRIKHPNASLWLYNYTAKAQYERVWNEITLLCRGLILDADGKIVARPFPKFFNIEEHKPEEIPDLPFVAYEKMDGSLGILYWIDDTPYICTRGSFTSEQAQLASDWLRTKYAGSIAQLRRGVTYLFEVIYPENKVVVDYGTNEGLVLLAILDNETGHDLPLEEIGFPLVRTITDLKEVNQLRDLQTPNAEGFVLRYANGLRVKVKFAEYVRLHRLLTHVTNLTIWELLSTGEGVHVLLDHVPDEYYDWVKITVSELETAYAAIENQCKSVYQVRDNRKDTAAYFMTQPHPKILFHMLDGKNYAAMIWQLVRPELSQGFQDA
jgi:RNA ligase